MKQFLAVFALLQAIFLIACVGTVDVTKTATGFYPPTDPSALEILKTRPSRAYDELGTVMVTNFAVNDTAKMHNAIRAKAAALGANAVILTEEGVTKTGALTQRWATGVAILFKN